MTLTMNEIKRMHHIQKIVDRQITVKVAAELRGLSLRQVRRLVAKYGQQVAPGMVHGYRCRAPSIRSRRMFFAKLTTLIHMGIGLFISAALLDPRKDAWRILPAMYLEFHSRLCYTLNTMLGPNPACQSQFRLHRGFRLISRVLSSYHDQGKAVDLHPDAQHICESCCEQL